MMSTEIIFQDTKTGVGLLWAKMREHGWQLMQTDMKVSTSVVPVEANKVCYTVEMYAYWTHNGRPRSQEQFIAAAKDLRNFGAKP